MSEAVAIQGALPAADTTSTLRRDLQAFVWVVGAGLFVVMGMLMMVYVDAKHATKPWPPKGLYLSNYAGLMITVTLFLGAITAEWAAQSARHEQRGVIGGLFFTTFFGVAVLNGIGFLFHSLGFGVRDHLYGTLVYTMFSLVALLVASATAIAFLNGVRSFNEQTGGEFRERIRATASFWHVVVFAWLVVYTTVYLVK